MTNIIPVNQIIPSIHIENDHAVVSSKTVAEHFNKSHKHVLRDIQNLECSDEFRRLNFQPSNYIVHSGRNTKRTFKCYNLTKDGFVFLAMGFTGKRAAHFKEAYIHAFNQMERKLIQPTNHDFQNSINHCSEKWRKVAYEQNMMLRSLGMQLSQLETLALSAKSLIDNAQNNHGREVDLVNHIQLYHRLQNPLK